MTRINSQTRTSVRPRLGLAMLLAIAAMLAPLAPAHATDADVMREFGMLGRLALDCSRPASAHNPYLVYARTPDGHVRRELMTSPDLDGVFQIHSVRLLAPDRLQFEETGRTAQFSITVLRIRGRFRSWESVRNDGKRLIENGMFPATGAQTIAFERCGD